MALFTATTKQNDIEFMSNICMIISEYADDNNIRPSHLADKLYEYADKLEEVELPDDTHIEVFGSDNEDDFIKKITLSIAAYVYRNDTDFMYHITGIWYALTKAQLENMFND